MKHEPNPEDSPVVRALRILSAVAEQQGPVSLATLSEAVRLPKPTVYRLGALLEREALVERDPLTRRYAVGPGLEDLALRALRTAPGHAGREAVMRRLSERVGETVNLAILHGGQVVFLERVECAWPLRMDLKPGSRVPVHCTANGKLLLAFAPPRVRERILGDVALEPYTPNTRTDKGALLDELRAIRRAGYAEDDEEFLAGVSCLAVPVRDGQGTVVAGLAISAPSARFPLSRAREFLPDLTRCAEELGAHLGAPREARAGSAAG